jgi:hypothetical protein
MVTLAMTLMMVGACGAPRAHETPLPAVLEGAGLQGGSPVEPGPSSQQGRVACGLGVGGGTASGTLRFVPCATPHEALAAFGRALLAEDDRLLWRLLPARERDAWRPEMLGARVRAPEVRAAWRGLGELLTSTRSETTVGGPAGSRVMARIGELTLTLLDEGAEEGWKIVDVAPRTRFLPDGERGDE